MIPDSVSRLLIVILMLAPWCAAAEVPLCELYAPGHFGNWYEVASQGEMRQILSEARFWGYNCYGDWFDTLDCVDPFADDGQYDLANALWDRKKVHFKTAQSLGLGTDLVITPNVVFRDQLKPEWLAEKGGRVFGQLICPHKSGAEQVILENHRKLFADLAAAGVRLSSIAAAPYDYGGCNCQQCRPWILTFAELTCKIHKIAQEYHPGVKLRLIGWWWSSEEHRLFAEWMDEHAPGLAVSISLHIPYDKVGVADVRLPRGCERHAFVHIGYAEESNPRDVYGRTGPVVAGNRLSKTVENLKAQAVTGVVAYSEGIFDDVNKALLGGFFIERHKSGKSVLFVYAKRHFSANDDQAQRWVEWLIPWGRPFVIDAGAAKASLAQLCGDPLSWRRRQWQLKAEMFIAHQAIGTGDEWPAARLRQVDRFWAAFDELQRGVYGTGPLRHSLGPAYVDLPWCKSWRRHQNLVATQPGSGDENR